MLSTHIALFSLQRDLLWPFFNADAFERPPATPPVTKPHGDYAETRCKFQIDYLLHEVLPELDRWMPRLRGDEIPKWLGRADPQRSLDRVTAMLAHLDKLLAAPADRDYHTPLYFGHEARPQSATSPALLALHAVLYSHARWGNRHFHDVESAVAAEALLSHYPAWIRQCVVSLVLLKNIFRTAISKNPAARETRVWRQDAHAFADDSLIPALADLAKRLWLPPQDGHRARPEQQSLLKDWHPGLASALALVADCYDARVGSAPSTGFPGMSACRDLQEGLVEALSNPAGDGPKPTLVVFEFGHYVFDADESSDTRTAFVEKLLRARTMDDRPPDVLWISLNRYWALHHGANIAKQDFSDQLLACLVQKRDQDQPACIRKNAVRIRYHYLDLDSGEESIRDAAYQAAFGLPTTDGTVWARLDEIFKRFREDRKALWPDYDGTPWAYVTRVLEILAHIYRNEFFTIRVERPQLLLEPSHPFATPQPEPPANRIALPREVPTKEELRESVERRDWVNPKLLVARALAALLLNQRMTFGNPRQLVQLDHDWRGDLKPNDPNAESLRRELTQSACAWLDLAEQIAERDGHEALRGFLDVFSSLPVDPVQPPAIPPDRAQSVATTESPQKYVLGIDIGATDVKFAVYRYKAECQHLEELERKGTFKVAWAAPDRGAPELGPPKDAQARGRYKDVDEFAKRVHDEIRACIDSDETAPPHWENGIKSGLLAVGVTWPGAVGGEPGHERVRAWSKILAEFDGYIRPEDMKALVKLSGKPFWDANAQEIHEQFKVREAFARQFFDGDVRHAPVTLINDGDGHVLHALGGALVGGATFAIHQEVAVLAAGSGTAMGVVDAATPRLLDLLAEAGKVIVDIGPALADCADPKQTYPLGTGGPLFSKVTLAELAGKILAKCKVVEVKEMNGKPTLTLTDTARAATKYALGNAPELAKCFAHSLLVGYLLEEDDEARAKVALLWDDQKPPPPPLPTVANLLDEALRAAAPELSPSLPKTGAHFAKVAAHLMGCNLADLVALTTEMFGTRVIYVAGGPMSGATGKAVLDHAIDELRRPYGFHLADPGKRELGAPHRLARLLCLERVEAKLDEPSGAHGAAVRAVHMLRKRA